MSTRRTTAAAPAPDAARSPMNMRRTLWFAVIGVVNTVVYYAQYLVLRHVMPYLLAHVVSTLTAMCGSYLMHCYITFRTPPRWKTFALFPLSNLANFVITTVGMRVAVEAFGVDQRIAPLPVALVAIPITYLATHYVMIGRWHAPPAFPDGSAAAEGVLEADA